MGCNKDGDPRIKRTGRGKINCMVKSIEMVLWRIVQVALLIAYLFAMFWFVAQVIDFMNTERQDNSTDPNIENGF